MFRSRLALYSSISVLVGSTLIVGCGDDDGGEPGNTAGTGGSRAGSGGAGGRAGGGSGGTMNTGGSKGGSAGTGTGGRVQPEAGQGGAGAGQGGKGGVDAGAGGDAGGGGKAPETFGEVTSVADVVVTGVNDLRGLTYASDGKIYASGHVGADNTIEDREIAIVRFKADGTLDNTFGTGGIVRHNLREREVDVVEVGGGGAGGAGGAGGGGGEGGSGTREVVLNDGDEQSLGIVELADGDLLVQANVRDASGKGVDVVLVRLDDEGELVESFGDDGVARIDLGWTEADNASWTGATGPNDQGGALELDPSSGEEKVVVFAHGPARLGAMSGNPAAQRTDNDRYVVRVLASDGSIDPDFNDGKVFTLHTGGTVADNSRRGLVEEDGSIVSAGYANFGEGFGNHIVVIRLTPEGKADTDFGFGIGQPGVVRWNPFIDDGGIAECYAVGKQSSGRYVTVGYGRATAAGVLSSEGWATTDGVDLVASGLFPKDPDRTFGRNGGLAIQSEEFALGNTEDRGRDLVTLADDRVVFVGRFGPNPAIFVTTPDGEFDTGSGDDGRFIYEPLGEATSHFYRVALSGDKKRVAATTNNHAAGVRLAVLNVADE